MPSVIGIGACYLDTILTVDHYPSEDEKLRATKLEKRRGGNVPNTLEVLQQLLKNSPSDTSLVLLSVLPHAASLATEEIRSSLGPQVDLSHCFYRDGSLEAPSSYILRSLATDSRTLVNYNDLEEMNLAEFRQVVNRIADQQDSLYHFEGRIPDVANACIRYVRDRHPQARISVELEKPNREGLQTLAQNADIVFYSKSWARAQGYCSAADCVRQQSPLTSNASYLFCTWGSEGATGHSVRSQETIQVEAFTGGGDKVLDTVGAGDTFIAGVLYSLVYNPAWGLDRILAFANQLAGHKVVQHGFGGLDRKMVHWMDATQ